MNRFADSYLGLEADLDWPDDEGEELCSHGRSFSVKCVECCPEDDDGSYTGDEWSEG